MKSSHYEDDRVRPRARHEDDDDEPVMRRRANARRIDDDEEEEPPRRSARRRPLEDDDEERPAKARARRSSDEEEDEAPRPKAKKRPVEDDEEEERPSKRKSRGDEDDDSRPARKPQTSGNAPARSAWLTAGGNGGGFVKEESWDHKLRVFDIRKYADQFIEVRLVGNPFAALTHWVPVKPEDALRFKNGEVGPKEKISSYPFVCPDYDHVNEVSTAQTCPHCGKYDGFSRKDVIYYTNAFVRIPDGDSEGEWAEDLYVVKLKLSVLIALREVINAKKGADPVNPDKGFSIIIKYNSKAKKATEYWNCQFSEKMPLSKAQKRTVEEQFIDFNAIFRPSDVKSENESLIRRKFYELVRGDYETDGADDERSETLGASKSRKRGRNQDEEDERPKSRKRPAEDDEEDEAPAPKSRKRTVDDDDDEEEPPRRSSRKSRDDEEDDDDDDDSQSSRSNDDDEDEPRPAKSRKRPAFEDEDDEAPAPKSRKKQADDDDDERPAKSKRRPVDDDEEEPPRRSARRSFEDDDDDEPRPRKSRR